MIDFGNTRLKWQCRRDGVVYATGAVAHAQGTGLLEIVETIAEAVGRDWGRVWIASVVDPALEDHLVERIQEKTRSRVPIERVRAQAYACGVHSAYTNPECLGADRWAALIGAWARTGSATLVLSLGTAVTCDALDGRGRHLGGVIAPGRGVLARALAEQTARLPEVGESGVRSWGRSTRAGIANGITLMLEGFVKEMDALMSDGTEGTPRRLVTGGDADYPGLEAKARWETVPGLVFDGLACLAAQS